MLYPKTPERKKSRKSGTLKIPNKRIIEEEKECQFKGSGNFYNSQRIFFFLNVRMHMPIKVRETYRTKIDQNKKESPFTT